MKTIAFVDDSMTIHLAVEDALTELLDNGKIKRLEYINPLEFLEDIKNGLEVDLVFVDVNMPEMNGLDLVKEVRGLGFKKPMVALTTENSPEMKKKGKMVGLTGWLTKPFSKDKLLMAIKRTIRV